MRRKSSAGMERKMPPSKAKHPDYQSFNGPLPKTREKKAPPSTVSAWIGIPRGEDWTEYVKTLSSTVEAPNVSAKDLER